MLPDPEIAALEERLAVRRAKLDRALHQAGRRAVKTLASPAVMLGLAALGILAGGGAMRRHGAEHGSAARRTGVLGLIMSVALWLVREQFGGPAAAAQFALSKLKPWLKSLRGDRRAA